MYETIKVGVVSMEGDLTPSIHTETTLQQLYNVSSVRRTMPAVESCQYIPVLYQCAMESLTKQILNCEAFVSQ